MNALIKKLFFKNSKIQTFCITRLTPDQVEEKVFYKNEKKLIDITLHHGMVCLDPFCLAVWLTDDQLESVEPQSAKILFKKNRSVNASVNVSLVHTLPTEQGELLLYAIDKVKNHQVNPLQRLVFFAWLLRSKTNTYHSRKIIGALYSYPRKIIIVSYRDEAYYNIFPMDIQGYIAEEGLYILGLRNTNVALQKILEAKKVVVCDTDTVDINTVYALGKHSSAAPAPLESLPFSTTPSELFGFPVPDFSGSYKEIEIVQHKNMGYHMLMVGKVVNEIIRKQSTSSLYHVGFLQFQKGSYKNIDGLF